MTAPVDSEAAPCPFCGRQPYIIFEVNYRTDEVKKDSCTLMCEQDDHDASSGEWATLPEARKRWARRTAD